MKNLINATIASLKLQIGIVVLLLISNLYIHLKYPFWLPTDTLRFFNQYLNFSIFWVGLILASLIFLVFLKSKIDLERISFLRVFLLCSVLFVPIFSGFVFNLFYKSHLNASFINLDSFYGIFLFIFIGISVVFILVVSGLVLFLYKKSHEIIAKTFFIVFVLFLIFYTYKPMVYEFKYTLNWDRSDTYLSDFSKNNEYIPWFIRHTEQPPITSNTIFIKNGQIITFGGIKLKINDTSLVYGGFGKEPSGGSSDSLLHPDYYPSINMTVSNLNGTGEQDMLLDGVNNKEIYYSGYKISIILQRYYKGDTPKDLAIYITHPFAKDFKK